MSNTYYKLYRDSILALAQSMVIKHGDVADVINNQLLQQGYVINPDRPETWKYYLNLNGEYHQSDHIITVRSMDTLETIPFTKASLAEHRATFREYQAGTRFYQELLTTYPNHIDLINGILSPIDPNTAIEAENGAILNYDHTLVESNEDNLIPQLQLWLYAYYARWYNIQYNLLDELYLPAFIGHLSLQLPGTIERLRLRNVRTRYVHSFHVREYLRSHNGLDRFVPYLTKRQQLWLYRNVRYIQRHVGKQNVFHELVANLLTVRHIPLQGYELAQQHEPLTEGELHPDVEMVKRPINVSYIQSGRPTESVRTILARQSSLTRDNPNVINESEEETLRLMSRGQYTSLPTKVLESEIVDRTASSVRSLNSVLINEWLHLITSDRYSGYITFNHPATGELTSLPVKDAFVVALYCFIQIHNLGVDTIPHIHAYDVLRTPLPRRDELYRIIDTTYVPKGMVEAIQDRITPLGQYHSPDQFYHACQRLHGEYLALWRLYSFQTHYKTRGYAEQLVRRHFMHIRCQLVEQPQTFESWMVAHGYDFHTLSQLDLSQLFIECVNRATGANLIDRRSLSEIQGALLRLMSRLSSYSVHYLQNINTDDFTFVSTPAVRLGDLASSSESLIHYRVPQTRIKRVKAQVQHSYHIRPRHIEPPQTLTTCTRTRVRLRVDVGVRLRQHDMGHAFLNVGHVGIRAYHGEVDNPIPPTNDLGYYTTPDD